MSSPQSDCVKLGEKAARRSVVLDRIDKIYMIYMIKRAWQMSALKTSQHQQPKPIPGKFHTPRKIPLIVLILSEKLPLNRRCSPCKACAEGNHDDVVTTFEFAFTMCLIKCDSNRCS